MDEVKTEYRAGYYTVEAGHWASIMWFVSQANSDIDEEAADYIALTEHPYSLGNWHQAWLDRSPTKYIAEWIVEMYGLYRRSSAD